MSARIVVGYTGTDTGADAVALGARLAVLFPLVGGGILAVLFGITLRDSMSPDYGSGSNIAGIGLVFILGVTVILAGVAIMIWQAIKRPAFFRGETLGLEAPESLRRTRRVEAD